MSSRAAHGKEQLVKENRPVALITGVGPGTGAAMARRFAHGGYSVAMLMPAT